MRSFIGIDLPESIKRKVGEITENFKRCSLRAKWVEQKNFHFTLKFLGSIEEEQKAIIKETIKNVAIQFKPFRLHFNNFGFFPNEKKARIFFIDTENGEIIGQIARMLEENLAMIGFPKEGKFKSHVTLARLKETKNIISLKNVIKDTPFKESFLVQEITFFKSTLTRTGSVYAALDKIPLGKNDTLNRGKS